VHHRIPVTVVASFLVTMSSGCGRLWFDPLRDDGGAFGARVDALDDGALTDDSTTVTGFTAWTPMTVTGAPSARGSFANVWTGSQLIVYGGLAISTPFGDGAAYDRASDTWTPITASTARYDVQAVWSGAEMLVFGGIDGASQRVAGAAGYTPGGAWRALPATNQPAARNLHTVVWTGTQMIVWGGGSPTSLNTGGVYTVATDAWTPTNLVGAPPASQSHCAVWTGSRMLVWGGAGAVAHSYDPASDTWTPISTVGAPPSHWGCSAVWTGTEMIVFGGANASYTTTYTDGGAYNPTTDSWRLLSTVGVPPARWHHGAVWTGAEMIIHGGEYNNAAGLLPGTYAYAPATDTWREIIASGADGGRRMHATQWTGTSLIVWGGYGTNTGAVLQ
jgi:hypothetical protein